MALMNLLTAGDVIKGHTRPSETHLWQQAEKIADFFLGPNGG